MTVGVIVNANLSVCVCLFKKINKDERVCQHDLMNSLKLDKWKKTVFTIIHVLIFLNLTSDIYLQYNEANQKVGYLIRFVRCSPTAPSWTRGVLRRIKYNYLSTF